ncbi:hypothetical protein [Paraburkholderia rhynchosiae]|uniref:hypothetical protein n=1 Tax=Paraburkholderia rhynchosiae TaxID=487049 RepID=UPI001ABEF4BB|nr:hypothetical protein [Paraburkholderia rhynchosiae]
MLGLTATPLRRDSQQPVMFILCGPIRHTSRLPAGAPQLLEALPQRLTAAVNVAAEAPKRTVFAHLAQVAARMQMIAATIIAQYGQGRKVLVLTERTDHLERLKQALAGRYSRSSCCAGASRKRRVQHSSRPLTRWPLAHPGSCWRPAGW